MKSNAMNLHKSIMLEPEPKSVTKYDSIIYLVMSDVVEEFSSLDCVCERLEQWRDEDMPAYIDAFAPMCLPKIFSPLVRLQLLFWNPLTV